MDALRATRARRLFSHEYGVVFYLGERVVRQHTPDVGFRIPAWPPALMRRPGALSLTERETYFEGVPLDGLMMEGNYVEFAHRYLMREMRGVRGRVIYERYIAIGGDPLHIRGQLYISRRIPHQLAPAPNRRAKGIADSDDEDPDGERERGPPAGEDMEDEGSEEVPVADRGDEGPVVGVRETVADPAGGLDEGATMAAAPMHSAGIGISGTPVPRPPSVPFTSGMTPQLSEEAMRQMMQSLATPEGRGSVSGSTPMPREFDWTQYVSFTPRMQTPMGSPGVGSVGLRPHSLSTPTSGAARGVTIREVSDFAARLQAEIAREATPQAEGGDDRGKGKAVAADTGRRDDESSDDVLPTAGAGMGVGPSCFPSGEGSTSYAIPDYPRDIPYFDFGRLIQYRVPDVPIQDDQLGALAHVPENEVVSFRAGDVAQLLRSYYNAWSLLTFAAPVPAEYMDVYSRRLAGDRSATYRPSRSRSRSVGLSQSVHGGPSHSARASRPPVAIPSRSRAATESPEEGVGDTEQSKRPRMMDPPPPPS